MTIVHTLEVGQRSYDEVAAKLRAADYRHLFMEDGTVDMHGIGLVRGPAGANAFSDVRAVLHSIEVAIGEDGYSVGAFWHRDQLTFTISKAPCDSKPFAMTLDSEDDYSIDVPNIVARFVRDALEYFGQPAPLNVAQIKEPIAVRLEPDDIIVLRAPAGLSIDAVAFLRSYGETSFPGHKVVVLPGVDLQVLKPSAITRVGSE